MRVYCLTALDELQRYADDWDRLSGNVPFRSWIWLSTWWRHYGRLPDGADPRCGLFVPCVFDDADRLVGLAPWYVQRSASRGRVVRPLGTGEVCSDYLGVLCQAGTECRVAEAIADHLAPDLRRELERPRWDLLELSGFDACDPATDYLARHLAERGNTVHIRAGPSCWRIDLPATWEQYVVTLSKSHRKQIRRLQRNVLDTGRAVLHSVGQLGQLRRALGILIDLHQRRRRAFGQPGCFASARFTAFQRNVMPELLRAGQLQLHWLELDGKPIAAEYHLAGGGVVYAYQSGIETDALEHQPGRLLTLALIRRAIEQGDRAFDFLRGDEPYKRHFRARPCPSCSLRVVPARTVAHLRHNLWMAGHGVKQWIKGSVKHATIED